MQTMRKSQTTIINIFFTSNFLNRKIYILLENVFLKLSLYCYICITLFFFAWQIIGNAVTKHQRPYRYALVLQTPTKMRPKILSYRLGISTQILITMDFHFFFLYFREVPSIQKKKAFVKENSWFNPVQVTRSTHCLLFSNYVFKQRRVHNFEKNWKNSVCIDVTNFANL